MELNSQKISYLTGKDSVLLSRLWEPTPPKHPKKESKKEKEKNDNLPDATPTQDQTRRKLKLPNGTEIDIDGSVTKEMIQFINNVPNSSDMKSSSQVMAQSSRCTKDQCRIICDEIVGYDCANIVGENIRCNFGDEESALKLNSYLTGNNDKKLTNLTKNKKQNLYRKETLYAPIGPFKRWKAMSKYVNGS